MFWYAVLVLAAAAPNAVAIPTGHVLHEKREIPNNLARSRVDPDAIIPLRIGLKQGNLEAGYDRLMDVSHPSSKNYGKHLSAEEVHDIFAPSEETIESVVSWLVASGIDEKEVLHYENKGWLAVDIPVGQAEHLLSTKYYEHEGPDSSVRLGCDAYHLPAHISQHVDLVKPAVTLSSRMKKRSVKRGGTWPKGIGRHGWPGPPSYPSHKLPHGYPLPPGVKGLPPDLQNCGVNITPPCIKALYELPQHPAHSQPENMMGLYETFDTYSQEDLDLFFAKFAPYIPQGTGPHVDSVDGGNAPVPVQSVRNGGESDVDLDLAYSIIYPQTVTVYQVDDLPNSSGETNKAGFLNDFFDAVDGSYCNYTAYGITGNSPSIDPVYPDPEKGGYTGQLQCGVYKLTRVVSISYGESEINFPKRYVERQCNEIMKLGLQGHSIFVASGDYGVASFPGSNNNEFGCLSGNGQNGTIYNPGYPNGCPYITSVGGTRLYQNQTVKDRESAMSVNLTAFNLETGVGPTSPPYQFFGSGGGFSNFFTPPSYQKSAVANYLSSHNSLPSYTVNADASNVGANGGVYNRAGRGYPDVAANGAFLQVFNNATQETIFGTSLASPIFASVITLINEERTAAGKGPVGFVNPTLYSHPEVLNDIVNGSNPNCGSAGFQTAKGWDPVTGLGTPNYPEMLKLWLSLP